MRLLPPVKSAVIPLILLLSASPSFAHSVKVSQGVGGTLHIEPNDQPTAGESSLVWFALTRRGGQTIPLTECDCQLQVFKEPRSANPTPILTPSLTPVNAERYTQIPGANFAFPQPGRYQLQITGKPKTGGSFQPFELTFPVTVAQGQTSQNPVPASPSPVGKNVQPATATAPTGFPWKSMIVPIVLVFGLGVILIILRRKA